MRWLGCLLVVCFVLACTPVTGVCNERKEDLLRADGGAYQCTIAEECPRDSTVLVCTSNSVFFRDCVSCDEEPSGGASRCVRHVGISCP